MCLFERKTLHTDNNMKRFYTLLIGTVLLTSGLAMQANERMNLWPKGKMPDAQGHQIAAMIDATRQADFRLLLA